MRTAISTQGIRREASDACSRRSVSRIFRLGGSLSVLSIALSVLPSSASGQTAMYTYHNDSNRSGLNSNETLLTPANVNQNQFGKLFAQNVDGYVVAQPLYYPNVSIPGLGTHNVVYVATQHDSVFAFDANNNQGGNAAPLWRVSLIPAGATTVPISNQGCGSVTKFTEIGIMGTPVIDPSTGTLYVVAKTLESGSYVFRLHALDVTTGQEKFDGPVVISASSTGPSGVINFNSFVQLQRPGLLLLNGAVYVAFGSNGCDKFAHGWVLGYNASDVQQQVGALNTTPDYAFSTVEGSIWQGGAGLAADSGGSIYFMTANGDFDVNLGGSDYSDSFVKLTQGASGLSVGDFFTPSNELNMEQNDLDLGSGGPLLLPDQTGTSTPHLLVGAGKTGNIYLINRDSMGGFNSTDQVVQEIPNGIPQSFFGVPAYWNNMVYFATTASPIEAYSLTNGVLSGSPVLQSGKLNGIASATISANGNSNGVLWLIRLNSSIAALAAWNASALGKELYDSSQAGTRDNLGPIMRFTTPTVANGQVYVGTQQQLVVYGLFPSLSVSAGNNQAGTVGTMLPASLQVLASDPYSGNPDAGVTVTFSDGGKGGTFANNGIATTNSTGIATMTYTLPTKASVLNITATSPGYSTASFAATATPGSPASAACSGGNQNAPPATLLHNPLVCTVSDSYKNPVPGVVVTYSDNGAGGSWSASSVTTNSLGKAGTSYTTPTKSGRVKITISVPGISPINTSEMVTAGTPTALNITSGNNQSGPAGSTLPRPLAVSVTDQYGNPVPGVIVGFSDGAAGGNFSSSSVATNSLGQASTNYTLPGNPGTVSVTASVSGLTSVVLTETAK
jgi:hypothetical protein